MLVSFAGGALPQPVLFSAVPDAAAPPPAPLVAEAPAPALLPAAATAPPAPPAGAGLPVPPVLVASDDVVVAPPDPALAAVGGVREGAVVVAEEALAPAIPVAFDKPDVPADLPPSAAGVAPATGDDVPGSVLLPGSSPPQAEQSNVVATRLAPTVLRTALIARHELESYLIVIFDFRSSGCSADKAAVGRTFVSGNGIFFEIVWASGAHLLQKI